MSRFLFALLFPVFAFAQTGVDDIDPFIGTGGHGHTHPAATVPFGMVQLGPDTRKVGWDGCSGYHYSDTTLYGFSHTHLSGTGVSDYSDIIFKPITILDSNALQGTIPFQKSNEYAEAGYYRVLLANGVNCEMTATNRSGIHRYTFQKGTRALILIDLNYRDEVLETDIQVGSDTTFSGKRFSRGWARNQKIFFVAHTNLPFKILPGPSENTKIIDFGNISQSVEIQVALSSTSEEGARKNLEKESADFDTASDAAKILWQSELNRIQVWGGDRSDRIIFATALYHAFSVPNLWSDVDGHYRGMDDTIHQDTLHNHYTVFSLWDTYRTAHPLYALVQMKRTEDFIATLLDQFDQSGRLPVWELAANETNCMIGYHSVSVLADAIAKGYILDGERVLNAMDKTANSPVFGLPAYNKYGYLSIQDESESVSKTLEYAYDDACISWTAAHFGNSEMAEKYADRATGYRSVIDPQSGLVRPRDNGGFLKNTDPREVNAHFTEANAWQYSFAPVQDLDGWMIELGHGDLEKGRNKLENNLDSLFVQPASITGRTQVDISGLIGQYAHGNEPSHHIAFLYNTTYSPWKAQQRVHQILNDFYSTQPDGLIGNEDCGQMSAWYIMASIGLYPLVPGRPDYTITTPIWDSIRIALPNSKVLTLISSGTGKYIDHLSVNGVAYPKNSINHKKIMEGGRWHFYRSETPTDWGSSEPYSTTLNSSVPPAPVLNVPRRFENSALLSVDKPQEPVSRMTFWTTGGTELNLINDTITLTQSDSIYGQYRAGGKIGHLAHARIFKKPSHWSAYLVEGKPNPQYTAGGVASLTDGILGDDDWRKGDWMGFQDQDVVIELRNPDSMQVSEVNIHLLKDIGAWIALPAEVELTYYSDSEWLPLGKNDLSGQALTNSDSEICLIKFDIPKNLKFDRFRVKLTNPGSLPAWHPGAGSPSFIFVNEIDVK